MAHSVSKLLSALLVVLLASTAHAAIRPLTCSQLLAPEIVASVTFILDAADRANPVHRPDPVVIGDGLERRSLLRWDRLRPDPQIAHEIFSRWGVGFGRRPSRLDRVLIPSALGPALGRRYEDVRSGVHTEVGRRALAYYAILSLEARKVPADRLVAMVRDAFAGRYGRERAMSFHSLGGTLDRVDLLLETFRFFEHHWDRQAGDARYVSTTQLLNATFFDGDRFSDDLIEHLQNRRAAALGTPEHEILSKIIDDQIGPEHLLDMILHDQVDDPAKLEHFTVALNEIRRGRAQGLGPRIAVLLRATSEPRTERVCLALAGWLPVNEGDGFDEVMRTYLERDRSPARIATVFDAYRGHAWADGLALSTWLIERLPNDASSRRASLDAIRGFVTTPEWVQAHQVQLAAAVRETAPADAPWTAAYAAWMTGLGAPALSSEFALDAFRARDYDRFATILAQTGLTNPTEMRHFLEVATFTPLPAPGVLGDALEALRSKLSDAWFVALVETVKQELGKLTFSTRAVRHAYMRAVPGVSLIGPPTNYFELPIESSPLLRAASMIEGQALDDVLVKHAFDEIARDNTRPRGLAWMDVITSLPVAERRAYTWRLLERNGQSTEALAALIEQLDPIDGVREAVQSFLGASPLLQSNRSDFAQSEVTQMFGRGRLTQFFPQLSPEAQVDRGTIRTQFLIAVRTAPGQRGLGTDWLIEKASDETLQHGVHQALGFRPAFGYVRLRRHLENNFRGIPDVDPTNEIRALTVQGAYEEQGFTVMARTAGRGDLQVEDEVRPFGRALESNLRVGRLSTEKPLVRRHFVYNWAMRQSMTLVGRIRRRAIDITSMNRRFFDIRVQVHNFPTRDVLNQIEEFRARLGRGRRIKREIDELIADIKLLLHRGHSGQSTLADVIGDLPAQSIARVEMTFLAEGFDQMEALKQIALLRRLRTEWFRISAATNQLMGLTDGYVGDRMLSEFAQTRIMRQIETLPRVETAADVHRFVTLAKLIVDHVVLDDLLTLDLGETLRKNLDEVMARTDLSPPETMHFVTGILSNSIDLAHQSVDAEFGRYDPLVRALTRRPPSGGVAVNCIDGILRASNAFMLSRLIERVAASTEVFNAGRAVGTLRFNPPVDQIHVGDIVVFDHVPTEIPPVAGIVTLASGGRLSHLHLLAKSLGIPNVKLASTDAARMKALDQKLVRLNATDTGAINVSPADPSVSHPNPPAREVTVVRADRSVKTALALGDAAPRANSNIAGPKALTLARLKAHPVTADLVPDGVIVPFGVFGTYARQAKIGAAIRLLGHMDLQNAHVVAKLLADVRRTIGTTPIPALVMEDVAHAVSALAERTRTKGGFHVRSDTNFEDLPGFNGAGLNESVPNVPNDRAALDRAIRRVWASAFAERAVRWRAIASGSTRVPLAEPSVLIQPTVQAKSSGVILSRGGPERELGHGRLSADFGIGSVVESRGQVEEHDFAAGEPVRTSISTSRSRPVARSEGGLDAEPIEPGHFVLTFEERARLRETAILIENTLGHRPAGWDIEWAIEADGAIRVVQARPAF